MMLIVPWLSIPATACGSAPMGEILVDSGRVPTDSLIPLTVFQGVVPTLRNEKDEIVPTRSALHLPDVQRISDWPYDFWVLEPIDPLEPDQLYTVPYIGSIRTASEATHSDSSSRPVLEWVHLASVIPYPNSTCNARLTRTNAEFRLCGEPGLFVAMAQESAPAARSLVELTGTVAVSYSSVRRATVDVAAALSLRPGDTSTLWFASFDPLGNTAGWSGPHAFVMPRARFRVQERVTGAPTYGQNGELDCVDGPLETASTSRCTASFGQQRCNSTEPEQAYGCATGPGSGAPGWLVVFGLLGVLSTRLRDEVLIQS